MKKIIIIILFLSAGLSATAQNGYDAVLQQIEKNNTTLKALKAQTEAQKVSNRTGIYLANPEVEFHYLWGSPYTIGNRTDISITQSFDFPTAYKHRDKIADLQNANAELIYRAERIKTLLEVKKICIELIYYNALSKEYAIRLQNAERIAMTYKAKFSKGDANILENNKAKLNLTTTQAEMVKIEAERTTLLSELKRLNGGKEIAFPDDIYLVNLLPANFEAWYASVESRIPALQYVSGQIEIEQYQVKLNNALVLPKFSAGYMSERTTDEHFQGVTINMSVPLWENKNRVKQAKAQIHASESILEDSKVQFYNNLQKLYLKTVALQQNAKNLRQSLLENNNEPLLKKALDTGEISLLNYLLEIEYFYATMNNTLEAERDFALSFAEFSAVEL